MIDDVLTKQALRERLLAARRALSAPARAAAAAAIAERVRALPAYRRAATVALYAAMGAEVDPAAIARAALADGKRVAYPRLAPGARAMAWACCPPEALCEGPHATREPPASAPALPPAAIDLVLVPGVAFDEGGHRLGRGRGHYDATLAALPAAAARVGLAFEVQLVPAVPREPHDARLDAVVTEARVVYVDPSIASGATRT